MVFFTIFNILIFRILIVFPNLNYKLKTKPFQQRNKEQEKRRKRAKEYLQPSIKKPQIYPLINGQVRSTEAGELTILPRNHTLENDVEEQTDQRVVKAAMEKRRRSPACNVDCGLSISGKVSYLAEKPGLPCGLFLEKTRQARQPCL